ncbi:hypothetical protein B0T14DRAFT_565029 [Immersiella caudata]|uniref:Major facilitator superfamily (MFS) profile domain-containing protein n=1 Tax=Immersiella caudata TaxID=314043 RepID=A0AA39WXY8_9PEZI|nr:hypothetical protein B0T14DRAFT_565029 [Immersiella caudata]
MDPPIAIPPPPLSLRERTHGALVVFVLCLGQFLSLAGMIQTVSPLLILAEYFDTHDYGDLSWFSAAYSMTVGTLILPVVSPLSRTSYVQPVGRLGGTYDHKRILTLGWAWFALWSFNSSLCTPNQLIHFAIFRALQDIGPALVIPNSIALIGRNLPIGPNATSPLPASVLAAQPALPSSPQTCPGNGPFASSL